MVGPSHTTADGGTLRICPTCGQGCTKGGTVVVYGYNDYYSDERERQAEVKRLLSDAKAQAAQASRARVRTLAIAARSRRKRSKWSRHNGPLDTRCRSPPQKRQLSGWRFALKNVGQIVGARE